MPVSTPGGTRTFTVCRARRCPLPPQVLHRDSGIFPRPPQAVQGLIRTKLPKMDWLICRICPLPPQVGQVVNFRVSLPDPSQAGQGSICSTEISFSVPKTASSSVMRIFIRRSAPGRGPVLCLPPNPPPKNESKISPKPEKSALNPPEYPPPPAYDPLDALLNASCPIRSYWARFWASERTL